MNDIKELYESGYCATPNLYDVETHNSQHFADLLKEFVVQLETGVAIVEDFSCLTDAEDNSQVNFAAIKFILKRIQ